MLPKRWCTRFGIWRIELRAWHIAGFGHDGAALNVIVGMRSTDIDPGEDMKLKITRAVVWAADIEDRPGGLAEKLEALAKAGANLDFVLARRAPESPGMGVVFVAPLKGAKQMRAASNAGFLKTEIMHAVRVAGTNRPGFGSEITAAIAAAGLSLRGCSAIAVGPRFVGYLALDGAREADRAIRALRRLS